MKVLKQGDVYAPEHLGRKDILIEGNRIARIADKNVQTYRAEGLQSQRNYVFRICSFGFDGETALYSEYQMIAGNTK